MTREALVGLREATNAAIIAVRASRETLQQEPIIWSDLSCNEAAWVVTDSAHGYAQVTISEAAVECPVFQGRIREELAKAGFENVVVVTEW